ncbi:outer membrane protein [Kistimonas asteriae]|uniref:outer membrane protein n=1 Tax=Kistimonas asteriae TaxID=517724 RepID=UPI001BAAC076|nr:outer membrane protein [Kistimonas asteriae]
MNSIKINSFVLILLSATSNHLLADSNTHDKSLWNRLYIGSHINSVHYKSNVTTSSNPGSYFINDDYSQLMDAGSGSPSGNDISGGINIGWNYAWDNFIFGIEADYLHANKKLKIHSGDIFYITQPADTFRTTSQINIKDTFSLRPKVGYMWGGSLVYITGGVSLAKLEHSFNFSETFENQLSSAKKSKTQIGWTIGAGMEHAINNNWSVKLEYLYTEFDDLKTSSPLSGYPDQIIDNKVSVKMSDFRVGINYRF